MLVRARHLTTVVCLLSLAGGCTPLERARGNWWELSREPSHQAPDPSTTPEAVVQGYAARTVGWRGFLAVHTWIALKQSDAAAYTPYEVVGGGVGRGRQAIPGKRPRPGHDWVGY